MSLVRTEGSRRMKEYPRNVLRSERNVPENMNVKVRQKEDLTQLTSSVNHGPKSFEVD